MKRLILFSAVLLSAALASATASWNKCGTFTAGASVTSLHCTLTAVGANHLVLAFADNPSSKTQTLSDTANIVSSWTPWITTSWTALSYTVSIFCGYTGTNTGTSDFTISYGSGTTYSDIYFAEETDGSFTSCAAALDSAGTGSGIGTAQGLSVGTITSSSASSTVANDTMIGQVDCNNTPFDISWPGWTIGSSNASVCGQWGWKSAGAIGSYAASALVSNVSLQWLINFALIKPTVIPSPVVPRHRGGVF